MLLLTILAKNAAERMPKVKAGKINGIRLFSALNPDDGNHLSLTAKTYKKTNPDKKTGILIPETEKSVHSLSMIFPLVTAPMRPISTPISVENRIEINASLRVTGSFSVKEDKTGFPEMTDSPKSPLQILSK